MPTKQVSGDKLQYILFRKLLLISVPAKRWMGLYSNENVGPSQYTLSWTISIFMWQSPKES